jgi:CRP/FNR family nitrogen fixation transcriptional regulator
MFPAVLRAPNGDTAALQHVATKVRFGRNETIFNAGDDAVNAYKVISGAVRICKHLLDGRRQVVGFRLPGDFFGLMEQDEYSYSAEAVSDVVLASYPQHQLETLSEDRPGLRRQFRNVLARRLAEMEEHLVLLGRQDAMERVASFLVAMSRRTGSEDDDLIDVPMGRQDIADYLGLTIETVCRAFSDLKRNRTIEAPNVHQFRLRNMSALRTLAANV